MEKADFRVIGVMSGTSLDGIDLVDVSFNTQESNWEYTIHTSETIPYDTLWFKKLSKLILSTKEELASLDLEYTIFLAKTIKEFISNHNISNLDAICSHGHTALHEPEKGWTYQIGNLPIIAQAIGKKVICDFRVQDVKLGGQGAPLVPIGDELLFKKYDFCLNLGGFANISLNTKKARIAYDICPVNIVMNHYVKQKGLAYDDEGKIAASGHINPALLHKLNSLSFYELESPKSLGLEWVTTTMFPLIDTFEIALKDVLRTFVEHVAIQITNQINRTTNARILVTGGGVFNRFLIQRIQNLTNHTIEIPSNDIINFKEALIFGLLGVLKLRGETNCLSSVTGAIKDHSSGEIFLP